MIMRELKEVSVISFTDGTDAYGQKRKTVDKTESAEMLVKNYVQTGTADPRFVAVENIGITKKSDIQTGNQIVIDNETYDVILPPLPSGKYYQVFMRRV